MASAIDKTVGTVTANSYIDEADAETYFDDRMNTDDWDQADTELRAEAVLSATRRLDQEYFEGSKTGDEDAQILAWPRLGTVDRFDQVIDSDVIPQLIKDAQAELTLHLLKTNAQEDLGLDDFEDLKIGPLSIKPRNSKPFADLPTEVRKILEPVILTGRRNVRIFKG